MKVENKVLEGDYAGKRIFFGEIKLGFLKPKIKLDKTTIERYEFLRKDYVETQSDGDKLIKGAVGGAVFGTAGAIVGATSSEKEAIYFFKVYFKDGKQSIIQLGGPEVLDLMTHMEYTADELNKMPRKEAQALYKKYIPY